MQKFNVLMNRRITATKRMVEAHQSIQEKVQSELLQKISPNDRIINSPETEIHFRPLQQNHSGPKPYGLWYAKGTAWIEWLRSPSGIPEWEEDHIFRLSLNVERVLQPGESGNPTLKEIEEEYGSDWHNLGNRQVPGSLSWKSIAQKWSGFELFSNYRGHIYAWKNSWDVPSGCIWDEDAIQNIERIF